MEKRILTKHPDPSKKGVNISKEKYDIISKYIIEIIRKNKEISFSELMKMVKVKLNGKFSGSIPWYVTTVKLDLEARNKIKRIPRSNPQLLRLTKSS